MSSRFLLCCCSLALACQSECALDDDLRLFAGDDAIDCGSVAPGGDRSEVDSCATDAFEAGDPFIARYEQVGVERRLTLAVAGNSEGRVKLFRFDNAPCGSTSCDPVTDVQSCEGPSAAKVSSDEPDALPIECEELGLAQ